MRKLHAALLVLVASGFAGTALAQGDRMLIDYVDISRYEKKGTVRYYIDVLDRKNSVIPEQAEDKLEFFLNDDPVNPEIIADIEITQFRDVGEPIAVGILFTNYRGFIPASPGEPSLFGHARVGIVSFLGALEQNKDSVGIWLYNEQQNDFIVPFTGNRDGAIDRIKDLEDPVIIAEEGTDSEGRVQAPKFYSHWEKVVREMGEKDDLPRRRILLVLSDGIGEHAIKQRDQIEAKVKGIIGLALDSGIKIYSFGSSLQGDEFLPFMARASADTYGIYTKIDQAVTLEQKIVDLAPQLKQQYVVDLTFVTDKPGRPSGEKVNLRVDATTPNGEKVSAVYPKAVKFPEVSSGPWWWLRWVLIGLGILVGLILLFVVISKIIKALRNRQPKQKEEWVPQEEYSGPDRGKLRVKSGPMAGEVFPLIEDITTIGSIDGNHIVLYDEGVSKRHAGIKIEEMRYELADFGSTNGTWVNGRKINKQFLRDNDEIRIGNTEMTFTLKEAEQAKWSCLLLL